MAKLKTVASEEAAEQIKDAEIEVVEVQPTEKTATKKTVSATAKNIAIPEHVDKILQKYPNYAKLAIDSQGGVYTEESQHLAKGSAILYQNPYYKQ